MDEIRIVPFDQDLAADFARLNYKWIERYFRVEEHDREMLDDPAANIIDKGGEILFAIVEGKAVGTVALIPDGDDRFELAKMAVSDDFKGKGIGDLLMKACICYAQQKGKSSIFLLSNTKLEPAINLYRKHGFVEVQSKEEIPYERVDIVMELALGQRNM